MQPMPGSGVWSSKQNSRSRLLPAETFAHTEQDFRGQVKPVPEAGAACPPKTQSTDQANPTSAEETLNQACPTKLLSLRDQRPLLPHKTTLGKDQYPGVKALRPIGPIRGYKQTIQALQSPKMSLITNSPLLLLLQAQGGPRAGLKTQPITNAKSSK